jgi:hypothetical protein
MLNPSVASATIDDPTIRRCIGFAKQYGFTHLNVVNLFALRATDPKELALAADPVGPLNSVYLDNEIRKAGVVIAAWGNHKFAKPQADAFIKKYGGEFILNCLGKNKNGSPKHPLYLPKTATVTPLSFSTIKIEHKKLEERQL